VPEGRSVLLFRYSLLYQSFSALWNERKGKIESFLFETLLEYSRWLSLRE